MVKKLPPIKRVQQRHFNGCAIAAIASVVGLDYDSLLKKTFRNWKKAYFDSQLQFHNDDYNPSLSTSEMVRILRKFGCSVKKANEFNFDKRKAILTLNLGYVNSDDIFHCIVWDPAFGGRIIDPAWSDIESKRYYMEKWKRANKETLIIN